MIKIQQVVKRTVFVCLLAVSSLQMRSQTFASFIDRLNSLPESQRQSVADSFMNAGHAIPYIENDTLVHFVYNSAAQT